MGKLAIQLSLAAMAVGVIMMLPTFVMPWAQVKSVGDGAEDAYISLWMIKVSTRASISNAIMKKASKGKYDVNSLLSDCEQPPAGTNGKNVCVFWTRDLYLSREATSEIVRLFGLNGVLGQAWQMSVVFWAGMINTLLLILGVVCSVMAAAYLYFYMEGKYNPDLRKIGSYYMAGALFCFFMTLIIWLPVIVFSGVDSHGAVVAMAGPARMLMGKGAAPATSYFIMIVACIMLAGALASQGSWKTESGEWKRERHKMKHEFEKWMDSSSSDEDETDDEDWDDSDSEWEDKKKKKSKKDKKKSKKKSKH